MKNKEELLETVFAHATAIEIALIHKGKEQSKELTEYNTNRLKRTINDLYDDNINKINLK